MGPSLQLSLILTWVHNNGQKETGKKGHLRTEKQGDKNNNLWQTHTLNEYFISPMTGFLYKGYNMI